ncbi:hypothetical protein AB1N83_002776 [Pleurotus pulmonarius]
MYLELLRGQFQNANKTPRMIILILQGVRSATTRISAASRCVGLERVSILQNTEHTPPTEAPSVPSVP